ncbi:hypothetical protein PoB_005840600 [Plakobranchus ocellatus]|uniref:Uncharacterized protein n=1 Tax=Plakobranchus ocellatus TaxID=259542 RepID=A0AAV4C9A3_9GAST|nr:hypothetical protein PoB_005840600 [Plakobranchus ocellatus]
MRQLEKRQENKVLVELKCRKISALDEIISRKNLLDTGIMCGALTISLFMIKQNTCMAEEAGKEYIDSLILQIWVAGNNLDNSSFYRAFR